MAENEWSNPLETKGEIEVEVLKEKEPKLPEDEDVDDFDRLSKRTQKRIKTLDRKRKEATEELTRRETEWSAKEADYQSRLENATKTATTAIKTGADNYEKQLKDKLSLAETAFEDAYDSGDKKKLVSAQRAISEATAELQVLKVTRGQVVDEEAKPPKEPQQRQPQKFSKEAHSWANDQKGWFGNNKDYRVETAAAIVLDQELQEEGYDPDDPDRYEELSKRLKKKFPDLMREEEEEQEEEKPVLKKKPGQIVAGGSRSPGKQKVRLTDGEMKMARRFGISAEVYAAEKLKAEAAEGSYSAI